MIEFLTAWGLEAHSEKVKKKCKTQKQRHRRRTICFVKNLNATGDVSTFYNRQRHWGSTVCFVAVVNGAGVLQYVSVLSEPGRPRSQKGAGPDLAKKWPILWLRSIEKWSFLEGVREAAREGVRDGRRRWSGTRSRGSPRGGPGRIRQDVREDIRESAIENV